MKKLPLLASITLLATTFSYAGGDGWMNDFEAAKAKAVAENKDLLIDFTGSDWCGWCIKLNKEVFSHDSFKEGIADKYILVELDYPKDKSILDEKTTQQNAELRKTYPVRGFPTILLADAKGDPYAQTGYQKGGPEAYLTHLAGLQESKTKRDEAFSAAETAEGVEKAKLLYSGVQLIPEAFQSFYSDAITQIKSLDPEDETGIAAAERAQDAEEEFKKSLTVAMRANDMAEANNLIDSYIAEQKLEGEDKQQVLSTKINLFLRDGDFDKAEALFDEIIAISPDSQLGKSLVQFRAERLPALRARAAEKEEKSE